MALLEVDPAQLVTPAPLITAESADENPNVCSAGASCSGRLPDVLGGRGERVGRPRAREGPAAPSSRPSSHRIPFPPIPDPSFTPRTSYYRWLRVAAPRRRRLRLRRLVTTSRCVAQFRPPASLPPTTCPARTARRQPWCDGRCAPRRGVAVLGRVC